MMHPKRWQEISRIFESALALAPEKRVAYINNRCAGDESLRREVEVLIESHQKAENEEFINSPAVERAAPLLASEEPDTEELRSRLEKGQEVGHYKVIRKLGAGGMGEVYLARDGRLERTVALKILPEDVASDQRRMQRFRQEAKIASSLNQPNILTIFEFGEVDALHYIATEYIDGETLRHYLRGKQIKLAEILDISVQVLAALDAAHEARIVHRDIKPENVMIRRRDHIVKVLDFGLAKLTEKTVSVTDKPADTEAATEFKTVPGSVMGTVRYMSPEQAQGMAVDGRTDLWSTGAMIYEMVAGSPPFKGVTRSHTVVEILEKEPAPLAPAAGMKVPVELQRIVSKALAKDPDERYQTAKDMLIDLKNLRRQLEVEADRQRSAAPDSIVDPSATEEQSSPAETEPELAISSRIDSDRLRRRKRALGISLVAIVVVGGALIVGMNAWQFSRSKTIGPPIPVAERTLNYWMTVQKYRDGKPYQEPFQLASEINFEKDYRVRLNVGSSQAGYLYILNEGPATGEATPSYVVLFPSPTANGGSAFVSENRESQIPEQSWIAFDAEQGTEKLWLVFSANTIPELETVKRFANPQDRGLVKDAVLNDKVNRFLRANSTTKLAIERNDEQKETNLKVTGDVLVHVIRLEHH